MIKITGSISLNDVDILQIEGGIPSVDGLDVSEGCVAILQYENKGRIFSKVGVNPTDWSEIGVGDLVLREVSTRSLEEMANLESDDLIHNQLSFVESAGLRSLHVYNALDGRWYDFHGSELNLYNHGVGPSGTYEESFENYDSGEWFNDATAIAWSYDIDTPSNSTGAEIATDGNVLAFTETSNPNTNATFILETNYFAKATSISFYYHMFGIDMGTLFVESYNGDTWQVVGSIVGQKQLNQTAPYLFASYDLSEIRLSRVRLRFVAGGGYRSDCCIDQLKIVSV